MTWLVGHISLDRESIVEHCSRPIETNREVQLGYCKDCGQQVGADDRFCKSCGSRMSGSAGEPKEPDGSTVAELRTYPCAYCDGSGEVDVGEIVQVYEACPVCEGACEIMVPADYVKCRDCDGTGKEDIGEIITVLEPCGRCRGTGWAPPPPAYR